MHNYLCHRIHLYAWGKSTTADLVSPMSQLTAKGMMSAATTSAVVVQAVPNYSHSMHHFEYTGIDAAVY